MLKKGEREEKRGTGKIPNEIEKKEENMFR